MMQYERSKELYLGKLYDLDTGTFYGEVKPFGGLRFQMTGVYGDTVDYTNFRQASQLLLLPSAEASFGKHINLNLSHTLQRLDLKGDRIFTANLTQIRFIYNFSTKMFVRAIVQYLNVSRDSDLYLIPTEAEIRTIFTQLLFSYKLNPQTVFFLGYSDNSLGMNGLDITMTDRTFFVKIGYAWTR
jgi:hypothetical protein